MKTKSYWRIRSFLRRIKITKLLGLIALSLYDYEEKVGKALDREVLALGAGPVWDIGANTGIYTSRMLDLREDVHVVAFEPQSELVGLLKGKYGNSGRVRILQVGLGEEDGKMEMSRGRENTDASLVKRDTDFGSEIVQVRSVEGLLAEGLDVPGLVKIDVEGYEYRVLKGFGSWLSSDQIRCILVEVHSSLLETIGEKPLQVVEILEDNGFVVSWIDYCHILAKRS